MPGRWVVVVPVKDAASGKTRLSGALDDVSRTALARAMALDTIAAAVACPAVGRVVVVTSDEVVARAARDVRPTACAAAPAEAGTRPHGQGADEATRVAVVPEPSHAGARSGLDAAAAAGVHAAREAEPSARVAVLLGDLPALRPDDLGSALAAAEEHQRATVPDAAGTGTTLLAVGAGVPFESAFGEGSAAAHVALGYTTLDLPGARSLRQDVDLPADLDVLRGIRPGPRTSAELDRLFRPAANRAGRRVDAPEASAPATAAGPPVAAPRRRSPRSPARPT